MSLSYQLIHHHLRSNSIKVIDSVTDIKHIPSMLVLLLKSKEAKYVLSESKLPKQTGTFLVKQNETFGALHRYLLGTVINTGYVYDNYMLIPEDEYLVLIFNDDIIKDTELLMHANEDLISLTH